MKAKRKLGILALIALIVGGVSSMATAETIFQAVTTGYPKWADSTTWSNGVPPADSVDSVVLNSHVSLKNDYILGADQSITQTGGGYFFFDSGTLDVFGSVNIRNFLGGSNLILHPGSEFSCGPSGFRVNNINMTTKWIANSNGVTIVTAGSARLTGSAAIIDLTDYDLAGSGSNIVLMTTQEEAAYPTFASVTLIAPTGLTYVADVDYAYNGDTQIALTNIREFTTVAATSFSDPDPSVIELALIMPSTLVTGSVDLVYVSPTNVNLTVTISEETHPASFNVLSATPQVLDPENFETTVPIEILFDNDFAVLNAGQTATALVTFAWSDVGGGDSGSFSVPISVMAITDFDPVVETSTFTGGDVGEGLDLSGSYQYMVNLGSSAVATKTVQGYDFVSVNATAGAVTVGPANIAGNFGAYDFGTNANDIALAEIMRNALVAWNPKLITVNADVTMGTKYELQMFFADGSDQPLRNFNVGIEGVVVITNFAPRQGQPMQIPEVFGVVVKYTFYATDNTLNIELTGGSNTGDKTPIIQAFTLKQFGSTASTASGTPHSWLDMYDLVVDGDYEAADQEDSDLDGLLNWEEYRCGTVPTNATSVLKLNSVSAVAAGEYAVAWQSVVGKSYNVLSSDNLVVPSWTTNAFDVPGVEPETVSTQTVSTAAAFFAIELAE